MQLEKENKTMAENICRNIDFISDKAIKGRHTQNGGQIVCSFQMVIIHG